VADTPSIVINRDKAREAAFEYEQLRREAIAHVQALSGNTWTDYNLHDPGVTILEQLCYAITDLAYRTDFPIDEILADKNGNIDPLLHTFFAKAAILSSGPVTVNDYRKLILDEVDEIENVWIEPIPSLQTCGTTKGTYRLFLQIEDELVTAAAGNQDALKPIVDAVERCMMAHRNIGEDVEAFVVLQPQEISLKAEIMVDSKYDPQELMAHMCNAFEFALHPPIRFFTEAELLDKGYSIEEIYCGPLLKKGFIVESDLRPRPSIVDPAVLVKAVSEVAGVIKVKTLTIAGDDGNYSARPLTLKPGSYPMLQIAGDKNDIKIFSDKYEYRLKEVAFWNTYQKMKIIARRKFVGQKTGDTHIPLKAAYRNLSWYYSLQHHFPYIYGIGEEGLDKQATERRKAQAKQLKAYLLFFEQLLANYLAQLGSMGNFFSPLTDGATPYTYAVQPLYNVPHVRNLLAAFTGKQPAQEWDEFKEDTGNDYMKALQHEQETSKTYQERKTRVLDHLLARFNLSLMKYPVTVYEHVYGDAAADEPRISRELEWKASILRDVVKLTANRLHSFDYTADLFTPGEWSGYENWLRHLLYIPGDKRKRLSEVFDAEHLKVEVHTRPSHMHLWLTREYTVRDEVIKVTLQDLPDTPPENRYDYGNQPVSFLKHGLSIENYRIVYDEERREYLVVYRHRQHEIWRVVIRASTRAHATHALQDMIKHLRSISEQSEGFYLVEHLLMKPWNYERRFGYRMYDRDGNVLKEHPYWYTFDEREEVIGKLQEEAAAQQAYFEFYIKQGYGQMLREDFYRFGLTVVFPAWPARFQLPEFRAFAEELFREHTPVQFVIQFKWLGIGAMRSFEKEYFNWLDLLRQKKDLQENTTELIKMLAGEHYFDL